MSDPRYTDGGITEHRGHQITRRGPLDYSIQRPDESHFYAPSWDAAQARINAEITAQQPSPDPTWAQP